MTELRFYVPKSPFDYEARRIGALWINFERFPSPNCPLCGGYADFEHVLWGCAYAGAPFTQEEMMKLIKAQDQTSQMLSVEKARERAVRFDLMVPEWA